MPHITGGKYGSHTTVTELGKKIVHFLEDQESVSKISLGPITPVTRAGGGWCVKIIDEQGCIFLKVMQCGTVQEIRLYPDPDNKQTRHQIKLALSLFIRQNRWKLTFGKRI